MNETNDTILTVPRTCIRPAQAKGGAKLNPRTVFVGLPELAEALADRGMDTPILVRPDESTAFDYQIVDGERRWLASEIAGMVDVPVICRDYSDEDVREIASSNRYDLDPFDEAANYAAMIASKVFSRTANEIDSIARKLGRTSAHVKQRLKLLDLVPAMRRFVEQGALEVVVATVVAQAPRKVQEQMVEPFDAIAKHGPITRRDVENHMRRFLHTIADATFDPSSKTLVPEAGACGDCSKRTGVQGDLFARGDGSCLDALCWSTKLDADFKLRKAQAAKDGVKVLPADQARKVLAEGRAIHGAPFVALEEERWIPGLNRNVPVEELVGPAAPHVLAQCPDTGLPVALVARKLFEDAIAGASRSAAREATKAAASKGSKPSAKSAPNRAEIEARERGKLNARARLLAMKAAAQAVDAGSVALKDALRFLVEAASANACGAVVKRRGLVVERSSRKSAYEADRDAVLELATDLADLPEKGFPARRLAGLLIELYVADVVPTGNYDTQSSVGAKLLGLLDFNVIRRVAAQELKDEAKKKPAPATKSPPPIKAKKAKARA